MGGTASAPDLALRRGMLDEHQIGLVRQLMAVGKTATKVPRELGGFELIEKKSARAAWGASSRPTRKSWTASSP